MIYKERAKKVVDYRHSIKVNEGPCCSHWSLAFFVLATYWNACSDLGTSDSYSLCNFVSQA